MYFTFSFFGKRMMAFVNAELIEQFNACSGEHIIAIEYTALDISHLLSPPKGISK